MTSSPEQEVWITLRIKGVMPLQADTLQTAHALLERIETYLEQPQEDNRRDFFAWFSSRKPRQNSFSITQKGDVIEIEEEAMIYDTT